MLPVVPDYSARRSAELRIRLIGWAGMGALKNGVELNDKSFDRCILYNVRLPIVERPRDCPSQYTPSSPSGLSEGSTITVAPWTA